MDLGVLSVYAERWPPSCRDLVIGVSGNLLTHNASGLLQRRCGALALLWRAGTEHHVNRVSIDFNAILWAREDDHVGDRGIL